MAVDFKTRDWRWLMIVIAALVIGLDRWSKLWVVAHVMTGRAIVVWPHVFRITHVLNTGAAFSMFEGAQSQALVRDCLVGFSVRSRRPPLHSRSFWAVP
jgi:signal peptidase II